MAEIKLKLRNWRGNNLQNDVKQAVGRGLYMAASHIRNESVAIAPLDEGPLTQTSAVDVDVEHGKASIYYTQPYAKRLHESQTINIRRGRQNKYLEKPMIAEAQNVQQILAREIKRALGG